MDSSAARDARPENDLERLADDAVAACGGDMRATVKALVADNIGLQRELDFVSLAMSYGFSRGWFARRREARSDAGRNGKTASAVCGRISDPVLRDTKPSIDLT